MGKTQRIVKDTFNDYFDRLQEIADTVAKLKHAAKNVSDPSIQEEIKELISALECELDQYADHLNIGGSEIIKHVA
jgi:chorismate mutase